MTAFQAKKATTTLQKISEIVDTPTTKTRQKTRLFKESMYSKENVLQNFYTVTSVMSKKNQEEFIHQC
jgi:hypothetical protein